MRIGIDIGGSHIAIALVNDKGEIVEKIENDIVKDSDMISYILNYVDNGIEKLSKSVNNIEKIGIAAPGNPQGTIIRNLVNLDIIEIDFRVLEEKYKIKIVSINDAKASAIAEKEYGSLKEYSDCAFLCLGTGIGSAVFLDNKLLQASRNPGFELGHMIINKDGKLCKCGKKGCFETYCSMKRFKEDIKSVLIKIYDKSIFENKKDLEAIIIKDLIQKQMQNSEIQSIISEYIDNLIVGLSNIIDIFEPEAICLGGSFVYFKDVLYDELIIQMEKRKYMFNKQAVPKIVLAKLKNDAGLIGATLI